MNGTVRTIVRRGNYVAAVIALVIVIITLLGGCTRTVTITGKYRDLAGEYLICIHPGCSGSKYVVTKAEYDRARVGQAYKVSLP
jgi:hypothetical protein